MSIPHAIAACNLACVLGETFSKKDVQDKISFLRKTSAKQVHTANDHINKFITCIVNGKMELAKAVRTGSDTMP
jgi:hypothetical protein